MALSEKEEFELLSLEREKSRGSKQAETPKEKSFGEKAFEFAEPTVEALGTAGGAALGTALGPAGTVGGAGLGYAMSREAMRLAKEKMGYQPPRTGVALATEPAKDILLGGAYEAGGRALVEPIMRRGGQALAYLGEKAADFGRGAELKAGKIARQALGDDLSQARGVLKQASDDLTAAQALATIDPKTGKAVLTVPTAQALLQRAQARDPAFFEKLFGKQEAARMATLQSVARGADQTAAREAQAEMKRSFTETWLPKLKTELEAANIAGKEKPRLEGEAARMREAAKGKVEDVRRFTAAQPRAEAKARLDLIKRNLPVGATKYTYMGELGKRAEEVAKQAAEGSLRFGDAARFAEAASQSLEAHGLRPLTSESIISSVNQKLADPRMAGNRDVQKVLDRFKVDLQEWTNKGGVIDAFALDSIRKNSVNAAIRELYPQASSKSQKELAASVLESTRPLIIDAVERAGGTNYGQYLKDYAMAMQEIAQTKFGAEALRIYETNPKEFVRLVEGNAPETVEEIFGPGKYNLAKELSASIQARLGGVSQQLVREEAIKTQAQAGQKALGDLLEANVSKFKFPSFLSAKVTVGNAMLDALEKKLNKRTMEVLTEAAKSAPNFERLINQLPARERVEVLRVLNDPSTFAPVLRGAGGAVAGEKERPIPVPKTVTDMSPRLGVQ